MPHISDLDNLPHIMCFRDKGQEYLERACGRRNIAIPKEEPVIQRMRMRLYEFEIGSANASIAAKKASGEFDKNWSEQANRNVLHAMSEYNKEFEDYKRHIMNQCDDSSKKGQA